MPGQVTGRWSSRLSPILSDDLHFAARPRVSLNVTVDGGGRGKEKKRERVTGFRKRGGGFYLARKRGEEERRLGGEKEYLYSFYVYIYI